MKKQKRKQLVLKSETADIDTLKPHPRNYRQHPEDQLLHIETSIKEAGLYRNIVVSSDGYILAGHGVMLAAKKLGIKEVPVVRVSAKHDDAAALKIIVGDNEIAKLGMVDDRALTEMLKSIKDVDVNALLGTGYDDKMLAGLLFVTRPASEIADMNAAAHWAGMPQYDEGSYPIKLVVGFDNEEDRKKFVEEKEIEVDKRESRTWSTRWPFKGRVDASAIAFTGGKE